MFKGLAVVLIIAILVLAGIGATAVTFAVKNLFIVLAVIAVIFLLLLGSMEATKEQKEEEKSSKDSK